MYLLRAVALLHTEQPTRLGAFNWVLPSPASPWQTEHLSWYCVAPSCALPATGLWPLLELEDDELDELELDDELDFVPDEELDDEPDELLAPTAGASPVQPVISRQMMNTGIRFLITVASLKLASW